MTEGKTENRMIATNIQAIHRVIFGLKKCKCHEADRKRSKQEIPVFCLTV